MACSGHKGCPCHTGGLISERDVQVTDGDLGHGVCVQIWNFNKLHPDLNLHLTPRQMWVGRVPDIWKGSLNKVKNLVRILKCNLKHLPLKMWICNGNKKAFLLRIEYRPKHLYCLVSGSWRPLLPCNIDIHSISNHWFN